MMGQTMNKIATAAIIIVSVSIMFFNFYSLNLNNTNHTGFDTSKIFYIYLVMAFLTVILTIWCKYKKYTCNYKIFLILLLICITGMLNIKVFEKYNIMMPYEVWIKKAMPGKFQ
jgi:hypothetical protein